MEILYAHQSRQGLLPLERLIEPRAEGGLDTQGLQDEDAHPNNALLVWIVLSLHGVVQHEHHEVVRSVRVDDERPEALVALQQLPEEDQHLWSPRKGLVVRRHVRGNTRNLLILSIYRLSVRPPRSDHTGCVKTMVNPFWINWKSWARCSRPKLFLNAFWPLPGTGYTTRTSKNWRQYVTSSCFGSFSAKDSNGTLHDAGLYLRIC